MSSNIVDVAKPSLPHMAAVERFSKLPVVEQTVDLASNLYGRVKETSPIVNSVLSTAEYTVKEAVDKTIPVAGMLEGPIKVVDSLLCSSLDFVENKIPAVKLPAEEMYSNTKEYVLGLPGVKCACQLGQQGALKAVECACAVSEYSTAKLKELKNSLEEKAQNADANELNDILATYQLAMFNVLALVSNWVGKSQFETGRRKVKNSEQTKPVANGNSAYTTGKENWLELQECAGWREQHNAI